METNTNPVLHRGPLTNFFITNNVVALVRMKMPQYCDGDFPLPILTHYVILPKGQVNLDSIFFNEAYDWFFEDTESIEGSDNEFDLSEESISLWDMSCGLQVWCESHFKKTFAVFLADSGQLEFKEIPLTYEDYEEEDE